MTNDQLRAGLESKLRPGAPYTEQDLTAFALGVEWAATHANELGGATAETAPTGAEAATPAGGRPAPVLIGDVVDADCAELRDMAEWFDMQGKKSNGDFLRTIAHRHEILFGAYWTKTKRELTVEERADCGLLSELDD